MFHGLPDIPGKVLISFYIFSNAHNPAILRMVLVKIYLKRTSIAELLTHLLRVLEVTVVGTFHGEIACHPAEVELRIVMMNVATQRKAALRFVVGEAVN